MLFIIDPRYPSFIPLTPRPLFHGDHVLHPQYAKEYMRQFLSSKASLGALGHGQGHGSIQKLDQLVSGIDRSALMTAASASQPVGSRMGTANGYTPLGDLPSP